MPFFKKCLPLLFLALALSSPKLNAQVNVSDSLALVALYNSTNGPGWVDNSNWLIGSVDTWYGVTVNVDRVTELQVSNNNLFGTIPTDVGDLSNLVALRLATNQLTGTIPAELGNLANLESLELANNQLNGSIPVELGNLVSLSTLSLVNNQLSGTIPAEFGNLTNLTDMRLFNNQLSGSIPVEMGNLINLTILDLTGNQLSGSIPPEMGNLNSLNYLWLNNNQLSGSIPPELGNHTNLVLLDLSYNELTGSLPVEMGNLTNLSSLNLANNLLTGPIPSGFVNLTSLNSFEFYNTSLCEPSTSSYLAWKTSIATYSGTEIVCQSTNQADSLALVALYNSTNGPGWVNNTNWLTGTVETWYGVIITAGKVTSLSLGFNNLVGFLPSEVGDLTDLEFISAHGNTLNGILPEEIANLGNLISIQLFSNQLTGDLPMGLGNMSSLEFLSLADNQFSGPIPPELGDLDKLTFLGLRGNQFTGEVPPELGNLTELTNLRLEDCLLTGSLPSELAKLQKLEWLYINDNQLSGPVPDEIIELIELEILSIQNNNLDYLPDLTSLDSLQSLSISNNKFTYADILPNQSLITENTSQQPFGDSTIVQAYTFEGLRLDPTLEYVDGQEYQWYKDGSSLANGTNHYYEIADFRETDGGIYTLEVYHPDVENLILTRNPLQVEVNEGDPPRPQAVEVISPNGDGINDEMTIKNIELYPDHRVLIYDVLGRLVYETAEYDNINNPFIGIGNANGFGDLPSGTYYYLIDVGDTKKNGTGFFVMKRT